MLTVGELEMALNDLLNVSEFQDFTFNGLNVGDRDAQVMGVLTAVDYDAVLADVAKREGFNVVVVHHGLWWGKPYTLTGGSYGLFASLFEAGIHLLAYHLPLDAHPEVGNNAYISRVIGGEFERLGDDLNVGFMSLSEMTLLDVIKRLEDVFPLKDVWPFAESGKVGIISGAGAAISPWKLREKGVRIFITGEIPYPQWLAFRRAQVSVVLLGHYHSEVGGPKQLARWIEEQLGVPARYVDVFEDAM